MKYLQIPECVFTLGLSGLQLLIYADIYTMAAAKMPYYRSNRQMAELFGCDLRSVQRALTGLERCGAVEKSYKGDLRHLTTKTPPMTKVSGGHDQNAVPPMTKVSCPPRPKRHPSREYSREVSREISREGVQAPKIEIVMPWESDEFADAWREWKEYKRVEKRFTFKSPKTEQTALHKLHQDAEGNEQLAIYAIGASVAAGWTGLIVSSNIRREFYAKHQPSGEIELTAEYLQFLKEG